MKPDKKRADVTRLLLDSDTPAEKKLMLLRGLAEDGSKEADLVLESLLEAAARGETESQYREHLEKLDATLRHLESGPLRGGFFLGFAEVRLASGVVQRAQVGLDDGQIGFAIVASEALQKALQLCDRVVLDPHGAAILGRLPGFPPGEIGLFENRVAEGEVQVTLPPHDLKTTMHVSSVLRNKLGDGQIPPGTHLRVNSRHRLAFDVVSPATAHQTCRYLSTNPIPEAKVERDIGAPPAIIEEIATHVRQELTAASIRRLYNLPKSQFVLFQGASGTGKSLAVNATIRRVMEVASEVTGIVLEKLPPRVMRVSSSMIYSKWVGSSERNVNMVFDEVERLTKETVTANGVAYCLPLMLVFEEIEALGRARGNEHDASVFDRTLSLLLVRMDPMTFKDRFCIVLATTNEPRLIDPALLRRIGGTIVSFGRLGTRQAFSSVLGTHVTKLPAASLNGCSQAELWQRHVNALADYYYAPNSSDPGLAEIILAGSAAGIKKRRKDFMTGALIHRAVEAAARQACASHTNGAASPGVTLPMLARAFEDRFREIQELLSEKNVDRYVDIPEGARVALCRKIPQPQHLPHEFLRNL